MLRWELLKVCVFCVLQTVQACVIGNRTQFIITPPQNCIVTICKNEFEILLPECLCRYTVA